MLFSRIEEVCVHYVSIMARRRRWRLGSLRVIQRRRWAASVFQNVSNRERQEFRERLTQAWPDPYWYRPHMPWYHPDWREPQTQRVPVNNEQLELRELVAFLTEVRKCWIA